jgi:hypothetical protein
MYNFFGPGLKLILVYAKQKTFEEGSILGVATYLYQNQAMPTYSSYNIKNRMVIANVTGVNTNDVELDVATHLH